MVNESVDSSEKSETVVCSSDEVKKAAANPGTGEVDPSCYKYEGDKCFYVDPSSGGEYEWDEEKKEWKARATDTNYEFDGETYSYTDETNTKFKWDKDKKEWVKEDKSRVNGGDDKEDGSEDEEEEEEMDGGVGRKEVKKQDMSQGVYGFDGENRTYTDTKDGTVYIWDRDKGAWFPKVDDDFIARYQMSYGFTQESDDKEDPKVPSAPVPTSEPEPVPKQEPVPGEKRKKEEPKWFEVDEKSNTKVYVSGLPSDTTRQELLELMSKCGLVMKDPESGDFKLKMYTEPESGAFKGDALCTYIKVESVHLALSIIDGCDIRGKKIKVERAKFQMKGEAYNPGLKPKKRSKKQLEKMKKIQEKLLDWRPDKLRGERGKNEKVVVVKNLFDPGDFDKDVGLLLEFRQDLQEEAAKCGSVRRVVLYDRHSEGVAQIYFKEAEAADACIQLLNGRWFSQRQLKAETWDGKTKYIVEETEEQKAERLKKWEKYIAGEEDKRTTDGKGKNPADAEKKKEIKQNEKKDQKKESADEATETPGKSKEGDSPKKVSDEEMINSDDTRSSAGSNDDTDDDN